MAVPNPTTYIYILLRTEFAPDDEDWTDSERTHLLYAFPTLAGAERRMDGLLTAMSQDDAHLGYTKSHHDPGIGEEMPACVMWEIRPRGHLIIVGKMWVERCLWEGSL